MQPVATMSIAMVQLESISRAPTTGTALYIVMEQTKHRVVLLHPPTLTRLEISSTDFMSGHKGDLWPIPNVNIPPQKRPINEGVAAILKLKVKEAIHFGRQFPATAIRLCLAVLEGIPLRDVPEFDVPAQANGSQRGSAWKTPTEARPGIVLHIQHLLERKDGITLDEAVNDLKKTFPGRNADGMRTTVRCQLNRIPRKINKRLITKDVPKRGKVFRLEA